MQNKKSVAYIVAAVSTVVLSILRVVLAPRIAAGETVFGSAALFFLVLASAAALLFLSPKKPAAAPASGSSLLSFGAVFSGALFVTSAVWTYFRFKNFGEWPFPAPPSPTTLSTTLLILLCVFALISGVFFIMQGVAWRSGSSLKGWAPLLALAPLVWSWIRICQYETSYYSSLNVLLHWYDMAALLLEMLFFLMLARFVAGTDRAPRLICGVSLAAGTLLTAACVTRVTMALLGEQAAFQNSGLVSAVDLGVIFITFGFAQAYTPSEEKPQEEEQPLTVQKQPILPPDADLEEDKLVLMSLMADSSMTANDVEDDTPDEHPTKPLELEEIVLRILENPDDEEK